MGVTTGTEDGKVEDEGAHLGSTVEGGGEQVVVLCERSGVLPSPVELRGDTHDHGREHGSVDADGHVATVLGDHGGVNFVESESGEEPVSDVEWDGDGKSNTKSCRDEPVGLAGGVHFGRKSTPGDSVRVVRLSVLT